MVNFITFVVGVVVFSVLSFPIEAQTLLRAQEGHVHFVSDAPLELIEATSDDVKGVLNVETGSFAFQVSINSFEGFNSALQRIHFQENYLESDAFPVATFEGQIVEEVQFDRPGEHSVRAKGKFTVHGQVQERIIRGNMFVNEDSVRIAANFIVVLVDHEIYIPRIVNQKIAEEIDVSIDITLK